MLSKMNWRLFSYIYKYDYMFPDNPVAYRAEIDIYMASTVDKFKQAAT